MTWAHGRDDRPDGARRAQPVRAAPFDIPGFVPEHVRPPFCDGNGRFLRAALAEDPDAIRVKDEAVLEMFPDDNPLVNERVP